MWVHPKLSEIKALLNKCVNIAVKHMLLEIQLNI